MVVSAAPVAGARAGVGAGAEAEAPKGFDAQDEYRTLLSLVSKEKKRERRPRKGKDVSQEDVYQQLMSKERRVLDTVDRVVNDAAERRHKETFLHRMPVHEIVMRTLGAVHALWDDLIMSKSIEEALEALSDKGRMPFIGISLIAIAIIVAVIHFV